jgi:DNA polymerase-4
MLQELLMRRPDDIERLYLDFDGFFASVEQQARPVLRHRPVGIVPFGEAVHTTCIIACSKEARARGVKSIMKVPEALAVCPDLVLVPQSPDLYRRAHNALVSEIAAIIPIDAVKSIDELTCSLEERDRRRPFALARAIKGRLRRNIGPYITCSIGFAANRQLAKMACKSAKPDGVAVWRPADMPGLLLDLPLSEIPGIGRRMELRLAMMGIVDMKSLLTLAPRQMRAIWRNVTGERLCYALHGHDVQAQPGERRMFGHGRVLPPQNRTFKHAREASRLLLVKAARRLRRGGYNAGRLSLWLGLGGKYGQFGSVGGGFDGGPAGGMSGRRGAGRWGGGSWHGDIALPDVRDDHACLTALERLWRRVRHDLPGPGNVIRLGVSLYELSPAANRQLDLFLDDDAQRRKWERLSEISDHINGKYGRTLLSIGPWKPPSNGYAGGKIAYTRIPKAEDFW